MKFVARTRIGVLVAIGTGLLWSPVAKCQELAASDVRLSLVEGPVIIANELSIADGKVSGASVPTGLRLDDLLTIERETDRTDAEPGATVLNFRGGRVSARSVTIADDKCQWRWLGEQQNELPLDAVYTLRLMDDPNSDLDKIASVPSADKDRVLVRGDDGAVSVVSGVLDSLNDEHIVIEVGGQRRRLPRSSATGIIIAQAGVADAPPPLTVFLRDGSMLFGDGLSVAKDKASLKPAGGNRLDFLWNMVERIRVRSSRVAFLADQKPVSETQRSIVTPAYPAQRGRSASGGPLMVGANVYESGLGVHAYSEVAFAANREWDVFVATVGLDAKRGKKGDCVFKVVGDGMELVSGRCRGSDSPREIKVPIAEYRMVVLVVEPGEDLDLGDHLNWCDARFVREKR